MASSNNKYYISSLLYPDKTMQNLTIDDIKNGELHALRRPVGFITGLSQGDTEYTENGFSAANKMMIESIIRQYVIANQNSNLFSSALNTNVSYDTTSKLGVAHGRQLAADAYFNEMRFGITALLPRMLHAELFAMHGDDITNEFTVEIDNSVMSVEASVEKTDDNTLVWNATPDGKAVYEQFTICPDMGALKVSEEA